VFDYVIYRFSALLLKRVDLAVDLTVEAINLAAAYCFCFLKCLNCCSIISSSNWFLSRVMSFFALLKTRSHSVNISGQDRVAV
jgi:hypothetical protein